jgi:hypothetical protein
MSASRSTAQAYQRAIAARNRAAHILYEAELAAHDAHQSHVDSWVRAAHDRLHIAVVGYEEAVAAVNSLQPAAA